MIGLVRRAFSGQTRRSQKISFVKSGSTLPYVPSAVSSSEVSEYQTQIDTTDVISKTSDIFAALRSKFEKEPCAQSLKEALSYFESRSLRTPIRDTCQLLLPLFSRTDLAHGELIDEALVMLQSSGRAMLFFQELFDYCASVCNKMTPVQLAIYIYECGRHGLRCKHLLDVAMSLALPASFTPSQLSSIFMGICRNSGDYSTFVSKHIDSHISVFRSLSPSDQLVLFRIIRQQKDMNRFRKLLDTVDPSTGYTLVDKLNLIYQMKNSRDYENFPARGAVRLIETLLNDLTTIPTSSGILVTDITDALDAMASLKIRREDILNVWMDFLVERMAEIKYSPICGLWQAVTDSLGHLRFFHGPWMRRAVDEIASSPFPLKSFASFQLIFFTSSLGRLNYFSEKVYDSVTSVLKDDVKAVNDVDMLATLLFPLERAAYGKCPELVSEVVKQTLRIQGKKKAGDRKTIRGSLSVAYSSLSLVESMVNDPRIKQILHYVETHMHPKHLNDNDFESLYRIRSVGEAYGVHLIDTPRWVTEKKSFKWSANRHRLQKVADSENLKQTGIALADFETADGVPVVVEETREQMMKWADNSNDRDFKLLPVGKSGSLELKRRLLIKNGNMDPRVIQA